MLVRDMPANRHSQGANLSLKRTATGRALAFLGPWPDDQLQSAAERRPAKRSRPPSKGDFPRNRGGRNCQTKLVTAPWGSFPRDRLSCSHARWL